jgi:hypothetical protein
VSDPAKGMAVRKTFEIRWVDTIVLRLP